jgi:hypothetical protein
VQSETLIGDGPSEGVTVNQETVSFTDSVAGDKAGLSYVADPIGSVDSTDVAGLATFLSRPVRIYNSTWNESDPQGNFGTIVPWYAFFSNTAIANKLNNFSWIRCNLNLKIIINASPFYYGAMLISYRPLLDLNDDTISTTADFQEWVGRSQRPHVWLMPQESKGGDLTLPFFYYKNWLNIQSAADASNMGEIKLDVVYPLSSANGAVGTGVTIQVFAWATDVELSGPSIGQAVQSQDEYGSGPISGPASAVANFADKFVSFPLIGRMATATKIGAGAVSSIAKIFGFTNVPVIENVNPFRPSPFPQLSSTQVGFPVEKLTLDVKNELSVDPGAIGLPTEDSLNISELVQKESLLTTTTWITSDLVDAQIFKSAISPWMFRDVATATQHKITMPPCAWVANMFAQWRGDIIFRFQFIKSKYHRGRVVIAYDPSGQGTNNIVQVPNASSMIYTRIVDLGVEDAVEIRIPYSQAYPWLDLSTTFTNDVWSRRGSDVIGGFIYDSTKHNGMLTMRVMNVLTAPVAVSTVGVIVTVRGAENLEFANPSYVGDFSPFSVQSQTVFEEPAVQEVAGKVNSVNSDRHLVNFGENVVSLRQLLRRSCLNEMWLEPSDTTDFISMLQHSMTRWPVPYGYDPGGLQNATGLVSGTSKPFNFTWSTPVNWILPAFVAVRGSMFWTFNVLGNSPAATAMNHIRVVRRPNVGVNASRSTYTQLNKNIGAGSTGTPIMSGLRGNMNAGQSGQALTNGATNSGLTVGLPNYTKTKFQSTSPIKITTPVNLDGSAQDTSILEVLSMPLYGPTTRNVVVEKYVGIGTDFNVYWFLNVPTTYYYIGTIVQV